VSQLDQVLDDLLARKHITRDVPSGWETTPAWGSRYKKFWLRVRDDGTLAQVDLFITVPECWGAIVTIRTGPHAFGKALMAHIKHHTPYRQRDREVVVEATGEVVPVPEEADYFRLAGVEYIRPESRTVAALRRAIAQTRRTGGDPAAQADQTCSDPQAGARRDPDRTLTGDGLTTVANICDLPDGWQQDSQYVYIGRGNRAWNLSSSKWCNPLPMHSEADRGRVLRAFTKYLAAYQTRLREVPELVGKTLVCWCAPKACHGDVLAGLANLYAAGHWRPGVPVPWIEYTDDESVRAQMRARLERMAGISLPNCQGCRR
jgi:hypothetical protein